MYQSTFTWMFGFQTRSPPNPPPKKNSWIYIIVNSGSFQVTIDLIIPNYMKLHKYVDVKYQREILKINASSDSEVQGEGSISKGALTEAPLEYIFL